jgi:uncharacterized protein (TIGR02145 family)
MKKTLKICAVGGALLGGVLALSACGDDVTKVTNVTGDTGMEIAKSADDFEKCDSASIGKLMFASDENAAYVCADSGWTPLSENSAVGCSAKMLSDSSGYKIVCGEDSVGVVLNGKTGAKGAKGEDGEAGEGCTSSDDGNGTITQVCGEDTVKVFKALCNGNAYEPAKAYCYEDSLYSCGGKPYNPTKKFCAEEATYDLCGGKPYDVTNTEYECVNGKVALLFTDDRDGQVYAAVKIGEQVWMAQNLNYAYPKLTITEESEDPDGEPVVTQDSISVCYNDSTENCEKYGRLYTWAAAMDSAGLASGDTANANKCGYGVSCSAKSPVRGVCPSGWHLPDSTEWNALEKFVADSLFGGDTSKVGYALKSTNGWYSNGNGSDAFGFNGMPVGYGWKNSSGWRFKTQYKAYIIGFWSSTEKSSGVIYVLSLAYDERGDTAADKDIIFPVRCVKDAAAED